MAVFHLFIWLNNYFLVEQERRNKIRDNIDSAKADLATVGFSSNLSDLKTFVHYREYILWLEYLLLMHQEQIRDHEYVIRVENGWVRIVTEWNGSGV
jgi:hypothetical protein